VAIPALAQEVTAHPLTACGRSVLCERAHFGCLSESPRLREKPPGAGFSKSLASRSRRKG
jgi:hypothetical protein